MKFLKAKAAKADVPDLLAAMLKITERLEALEKKMDLVLSQTSVRSFEGRERLRTVPQSVVSSKNFRQPDPSPRADEAKPAQSQPQVHSNVRRERVLHKAVCADCHKDCEIPFKPTGERPVYCKGCFSKRKTGNSFKENRGSEQEPNPPKATDPVVSSKRQVVVTKKGVGKVTVSEIVCSSARDISGKGKGNKPETKLKR